MSSSPHTPQPPGSTSEAATAGLRAADLGREGEEDAGAAERSHRCGRSAERVLPPTSFSSQEVTAEQREESTGDVQGGDG